VRRERAIKRWGDEKKVWAWGHHESFRMSWKLLSLNILPLTRSAIHFEASKRTKTRSERKREGKRVGGKVKVGIYSIYIKRETERNKEKEREDRKSRK